MVHSFDGLAHEVTSDCPVAELNENIMEGHFLHAIVCWDAQVTDEAVPTLLIQAHPLFHID